MSISYSLHIRTHQSPADVLARLFEISDVETVPNSDVQYVRGSVFLAHGKPTESQTQTRYQEQFGVTPTVSILFFPDGVSDHDTALDLLAQATSKWLNTTEDDVLLLANNKLEVLKRQFENLTIGKEEIFWTTDRRIHLDIPRSER